MIELAPYHKIGLSLTNPILMAAGCSGYGQAYRRLIDQSLFGAIVTNPITLRPKRGKPQPRLIETETGLILNTGEQNPGVKKIIRQYSKLWRTLTVPIIAHLPADAPDDLQRTARALDNTAAISAVELAIPHQASPQDLQQWVKAIQAGSMAPILAKLPLGVELDLIEAAVEVLVDALVIGVSPLGAALSSSGEIINGHLYGPALHPLMLHEVQLIAESVDIPLIATGGVHTLAEAQTLLAAGARAVQLDTLLWVDPKRAEAIAGAFGDPV